VLDQNDEYERDFLKGLEKGFGASTPTRIVAGASYELTDVTVDSQITSLKASGANVLANFSTPKFASQAIRKVAELGWKPLQVVATMASSIGAVLKPPATITLPARRRRSSSSSPIFERGAEPPSSDLSVSAPKPVERGDRDLIRSPGSGHAHLEVLSAFGGNGPGQVDGATAARPGRGFDTKPNMLDPHPMLVVHVAADHRLAAAVLALPLDAKRVARLRADERRRPRQ
jgi:hypothetical protein